MPTYVYKFVDTGETIEVQQAFTDDTLTEIAHPDSGQVKAVKKVFQPVGVTFHGSGFFKTDNRGTKTGGAKADNKSEGTSGGGDSKSSDSSTPGTSGTSSSDTSTSSTTSTSKESSTSSSTSSAKSD